MKADATKTYTIIMICEDETSSNEQPSLFTFELEFHLLTNQELLNGARFEVLEYNYLLHKKELKKCLDEQSQIPLVAIEVCGKPEIALLAAKDLCLNYSQKIDKIIVCTNWGEDDNFDNPLGPARVKELFAELVTTWPQLFSFSKYFSHLSDMSKYLKDYFQ